MIEALQAIQSSIEIVGKLRELSKKVGDADFKMLLADLSSELGDAKLEAAGLKAELASLRQENTELKARLEQRESGKPKLINSVYRFDGEDGSFCTACFDVKQRKVQVRRLTGAFHRLRRMGVSILQSDFRLGGYQRRPDLARLHAKRYCT